MCDLSPALALSLMSCCWGCHVQNVDLSNHRRPGSVVQYCLCLESWGQQVISLRLFQHTLDPCKKQRSVANCWGCKLPSSGHGVKELEHLHVGDLGLFVLTVC